VLRELAGRHQDHVKAHLLLRVGGVAGKPQLGGDDPLFAAFGHGLGRFVGPFARFHLDEDQRPAAARDDVDLAERRFEAARENAVALGDQKHGGAAFGRKPEPESSHALGPGRAGRSKRLGAACHQSLSRAFSSVSASARW